MKLTARQEIIGIVDDDGLRALDGIKFFKVNVQTAEELIDLFEKGNPECTSWRYEIERD